MNNDLISRSALKEFINDGKVCDICPNKKLNCAIHCDFPDTLTPLWEKVIDSIPTIDDLSEYSDKLWKKAYERGKAEAITNEDIKSAINEGFKNGYEMAKAKFERPQGEWLTNRVAFHLTCPFCGCNLRALKDKVFEGDYEYNFCPNCGARMTKEAENECKNDT